MSRNIVVCPPEPGPGVVVTQAIVSGSPGSTSSGAGRTQPPAAISAARSRSARSMRRLPVPRGEIRLDTRVAIRPATPL